VQIFTEIPKPLDWGSSHSNYHATPRNLHLVVVLGFPSETFAFLIQ
jgi:hypothetical protein